MLQVEATPITLNNKIKINIIVRDHGKGLSQIELAELESNRYQNFTKNHYNRSGGLGIGLTVFKKYIEVLDGKYSIESIDGLGTCISCELFVDVYQPFLPSIANKNERQQSLKTILVVDDVKDNREIIKMFIHGSDVEVVEAENGMEAVEKALSQQFDLILMDLQMPIMDGYTAISNIRAYENRENKSKTPIWVITAHALDGEMEKCNKIGADLLMKKPLDRKAFLRAIKNFNKH